MGPDGSGFTLAKRHPFEVSHIPANWVTSAQKAGTPGAENFPSPGLTLPALAINELPSVSDSMFWIEIANDDDSSLSLNGYEIVSSSHRATSMFSPTNRYQRAGICRLSEPN